MQFYDGPKEQWNYQERGWDTTKGTVTSFGPGIGNGKYILHHLRFAGIILALIFLPMILLFSIFLISIDGFVDGLIFSLQMSGYLFLFFGAPVVVVVVVLMFFQHRKIRKRTYTNIVRDGVEIVTQESDQMPPQITFVPFDDIKDIRPVTDEEWKGDLGMYNPFRLIFAYPRRNLNNRFLPGSPRRSMMVIDLYTMKPFIRYKQRTGGAGVAGSLLFGFWVAMLDQQLIEEKELRNKIILSISSQEMDSFKASLDQARQAIKDKEEEMFRKYEQEQEEISQIDDSSFMDLFSVPKQDDEYYN